MNERSKQVRRDIVKLSKANGGYHYGGSFSCVEILLSLFDHVLTPQDRFILSKGHACWGLYVLLREKGLNPLLEGHPHQDLNNGVVWTTGSLGHGLPAAVGMALARKVQGIPGKVYVVMGDGECQEGTTWESMLMAVQHDLDNLIVIVDWNKCQGSGATHKILSVDCLVDVAREIGWGVACKDGHDINELVLCLGSMSENKYHVPNMIIADTIKGKGASIMEGKPEWHARWPNKEEEESILADLASAEEVVR